ncbi:PHP domain-containing protein [Halarchaeum nitratireducens]|uniref:Histidinol-phosphatase n=1 Tax=Halarchaeum nitratireducens TaxID=489913 RepID=A0A830G9V9_9EURY|nr:PHP domain-containing protein [Halarchaeum nitratireducens]MBP2250140.1 putative metal-dependent phosphoesterase TrpH [Halarchaeum solikamskense]GGN11437.1 histidinol-phosphatase [Halarchaeum nitratireducens]
MPYADLHVHTTASDGSMALADVPAAAERAGVSAVAVTDHDTVHPALPAPLTERGGVEIVRGIELRVETPAERVDLLGYGVRETSALRGELERLGRDRIERGRRIVENVEAELGIDLALDVGSGFGRPHVARAVVAHPDTSYDEVGPVFADLIGEDAPCYVARDVPSFERGRDLLADACGAVGLAHPLRYADPDAALARCASLDAVELHYPYDRPVGRDAADHADGHARVRRAVEEHDLLALGGSDAHDDALGVDGIDSGEYHRLRRRIPG